MATEKKTVKEVKCQPRAANFAGLREILFEELNLMRAGEISIGRARTISQLARRIIEAATLDLCARQQLGDGTAPDIKRLMGNAVQG
jgi:hypothetical protein